MPSTSTTTTLRITGMTCAQCAKTVEEALNHLSGVKARVSFLEGTAHVELKKALPVEALIDAIRARGYGAEPLDTTPSTPLRAGHEGRIRIAIVGSGSAAFACAIRAARGGGPGHPHRERGARGNLRQRGLCPLENPDPGRRDHAPDEPSSIPGHRPPRPCL